MEELEEDGSDFDDDSSQSNFGAYLNVDLESNDELIQEENDGSNVTSRKCLTPDTLGVCDENCHPGKV